MIRQLSNVGKRVVAGALTFALMTGVIYTPELKGAAVVKDPMAGMSKEELQYYDQDPELFKRANEYGDGNVGFDDNGNPIDLSKYENVDEAEGELAFDVEEEAAYNGESAFAYDNDYSLDSTIATTGTVKSPFTKSTYKHNARYKGFAVANGIDVSEWQHNINWKKAKASGVEFAIIRVGYRAGGTGKLYDDPYYKRNISGALSAGIKVGVYVFSQAISPAEGRQEARYLINRVGRYNITLPLVLDYEFLGGTSGRLYKAHSTRSEATAVAIAFCKTVESAGYTPMVYSNPSMLTNNLYGSQITSRGYKIWLAHFGKNNGTDRNFATFYTGAYSFWQYTSVGHVGGIAGNVDCNFWYMNSVAKSESDSSKKKTSDSKKEAQRAAKVATAISITDDVKTMKTGTTQVLYYSLKPSGIVDDITWTSNRNNIAYVQNGVVTAVSPGEAVITGTTSSGATDTIKIIVSENLSKYSITSLSNKAYTGNEIIQDVSVRSSSKQATTGKVKAKVEMFSVPDKAGTYVTKVAKNASVKIYATSGSYYACSYKKSGKTYYGYVLKSKITATTAYKTLLKGRDYNIKYSNNTKTGTALVEAIATDNGMFSGTTSDTFAINTVDIAKATLVNVDDQAYTGSPITPDVRLYYKGEQLVKDVDYTLNYEANVGSAGNISVAYVNVAGKGNFTGSVKTEFRITSSSIRVESIRATNYTGNAITPNFIVKNTDGLQLSAASDYSVALSDNVNVGCGKAVITCGADTFNAYYPILPAELNAAGNISVTDGSYSYSQKEYKPSVNVTAFGNTLAEGTDYTLLYQNNTVAGNAEVIAIGTGNYKGRVSTTFAISPKSISEVNVNDIAKQAYKGGSEVKPNLLLTDSGTQLLPDVDYVVSFDANVKRGTATVAITGKGNYEGTVNKTFTIGKKTISSCKILKITNKKRTGKKIKPTVTISNSGNKLVKGRDYTISYGANKKRGKGSVTIKGKGNYSGKKKLYFRIV